MSVSELMVYGLKKIMSASTNITFYSEDDTVKGLEYVYISGGIDETTALNAGSSTFIGQYTLDYISNSKNQRTIRSQKSKIVEAFADNNNYSTSAVHYYFNGEVINIEDSEDEDDGYIFRITLNLSHTKVS